MNECTHDLIELLNIRYYQNKCIYVKITYGIFKLSSVCIVIVGGPFLQSLSHFVLRVLSCSCTVNEVPFKAPKGEKERERRGGKKEQKLVGWLVWLEMVAQDGAKGIKRIDLDKKGTCFPVAR